MSLKSFLAGLGRWLFGKAKQFFDRNREDILLDLEEMAKTAVLSVILNDRGKAVDEIVATAKATGLTWGQKLLEHGEDEIRVSLLEHYTESDLKRYLGLARLSTSLLQKVAGDKIPGTHVLLGLIQAALMDLEGS